MSKELNALSVIINQIHVPLLLYSFVLYLYFVSCILEFSDAFQDETQLSENIDVLVSRLAELEEECQQLQEQHKALQDSHNLCAPTISMLKEQLNRSHQVCCYRVCVHSPAFTIFQSLFT